MSIRYSCRTIGRLQTRIRRIDCLSVTSHTLPHAASGSYQGPVNQPSPPTTRDPVAQAPTTDQGEYN